MYEDDIRKLDELIVNLKAEIKHRDLEIFELKKQLKGHESVQYDKYGFQFTKRVIYYISQGIEEARAIMLAWDDFPSLSMSTAELIWYAARPVKSGLKLYARAYCAHKMKKAGFKKYEIACTLGVSITTVSKILKNCIIE